MRSTLSLPSMLGGEGLCMQVVESLGFLQAAADRAVSPSLRVSWALPTLPALSSISCLQSLQGQEGTC
jgi:hypothetical protein